MATVQADKPWITVEGEKLLRKIQKRILAKPKEYRQDEWHCGTAMCVAGHAVLLAGIADSVKKSRFKSPYGTTLSDYCPYKNDRRIGTAFDWERLGAKALGIDEGYAKRLFNHPGGWPAPFAMLYGDATGYVDRAAVAAIRIDHFIRTGE